MKLIPLDAKTSAERATDPTDLEALFKWAKEVLRGQFEKLQRATTRGELEAIEFDAGDLTVIMAIRDALHPGTGKRRKKHFENLNDKWLKAILSNFLLTTVAVADDKAVDLDRFLAVPTTGWCQLNNERWVFVLPHTPKLPKDLPAGELAIFQSENLHLQHGFAIAGTAKEWCEQIAAPFAGNSNVILAVGVALSGPLTVWAGTPPGLFHNFCPSKRGKSLVSAIGQSIYGRPLIPNETVTDPFGMSWLATANSIGRLTRLRSSIGGFFEELNQGKAQDIADAAYRIANGIDKMRMRGRDLEPRLTYCVPGFSTGEEPMVGFLTRAGQRVTLGMRARFADVPAEITFGSAFETFDADAIPGLAKKYYPLLGKLYGAVGDAWLQRLVDMGPDEISATVSPHQQEFRSRSKVQGIYRVAAPHQRSVIDRFGTAAAACRMAIEVGLLPWKVEDVDAGVEACMARWADHDQLGLDVVVAAVVAFMTGRQSWEGTASELLVKLNRAVDSPECSSSRR